MLAVPPALEFSCGIIVDPAAVGGDVGDRESMPAEAETAAAAATIESSVSESKSQALGAIDTVETDGQVGSDMETGDAGGIAATAMVLPPSDADVAVVVVAAVEEVFDTNDGRARGMEPRSAKLALACTKAVAVGGGRCSTARAPVELFDILWPTTVSTVDCGCDCDCDWDDCELELECECEWECDSLFSSWTGTAGTEDPMSCDDDICLIWDPIPLILLLPDADVFDLALAFDVSISFAT